MGPCIESNRTPSQDYPQVVVAGRVIYEHRFVWEEAYGPIPAGFCVCHRCDNTRCIRLDHLFLGTQADNMRDKVAKGRHSSQRQTHCAQGHPFDETNTAWKNGWRVCRRCRSESRRQWEAKLRETPEGLERIRRDSRERTRRYRARRSA